MCGRFAIDSTVDHLWVRYIEAGGSIEEARKRFRAGDWDWWRARFSIAPTNRVPVIAERFADDQVERGLVGASWGFKPVWSKAPLINATAEKLTTSRTWIPAMKSSRVLVPMSGYYEWTTEAGGKQPHYIFGEDLTAAGLIEQSDEGPRFTIVTSPGRDAAGTVHDRMPLFVGPGLREDWLDPSELDKSAAETLRDHAVAESAGIAKTLEVRAVSKRVNSVRAVDPTDPSLIEPV